MSKKIKILLILLVIIAVILILLFVFRGKEKTKRIVLTTPTVQAPIASPQKILPRNLKLLHDSLVVPTLKALDNKIRYFAQNNGHLFETGFDGSDKKMLLTKNLNNLIEIIWSPDGSKIIEVFKDKTNTKKVFVDTGTKQEKELSGNIYSLVFSPKGDKIAYVFYDSLKNQGNISIANPDGTNFGNIFLTRIKDWMLHWPKPDLLIFYQKPSGLAASDVFIINPNKKELPIKIMGDVHGFVVKPSEDGQMILYSKTNAFGKDINLYIADKNGENEKNLKLAAFVEKCAWSKDNLLIYCAVPEVVPQLQVFPDDFYKGAYIFNDSLYKIDVLGGIGREIVSQSQLGEKFDISELELSPDEDYLIFVNKIDGLPYSLKIK